MMVRARLRVGRRALAAMHRRGRERSVVRRAGRRRRPLSRSRGHSLTVASADLQGPPRWGQVCARGAYTAERSGALAHLGKSGPACRRPLRPTVRPSGQPSCILASRSSGPFVAYPLAVPRFASSLPSSLCGASFRPLAQVKCPPNSGLSVPPLSGVLDRWHSRNVSDRPS